MLATLGSIYGKIAGLRNTFFDRGWLKNIDLGSRTISVGNITAGGSGKTPLVILISELLAARGEKICILTRGYGRKNAANRVLVSGLNGVLVDAETGGDEPVEIATRLAGRALVIADADRAAAAAWAKKEFEITTFLLDDAFQHRRAKRDVDIVCVDATDPFGGGKMLPAGRLREPLDGLKRADMIVITRSDLVDDLDAVSARVRQFATNASIHYGRTQIAGFIPLAEHLAGPQPAAPTERTETAPEITNVLAFSGLGNNGAFFEQLRRCGIRVAGTHEFKDHHFYRQSDIGLLERRSLEAGAKCLVTTAKDAAKLSGLNFEIPCFVALSQMVIDDIERFAAQL